MIVGGSVSVTGWPAHSTQPGAMLTEILSLMGARVVRRGGALTVTGGAAASRASISTCRPRASSPPRSSRSPPSPTARPRSTASATSAATRPTASRRSSASCAASAARPHELERRHPHRAAPAARRPLARPSRPPHGDDRCAHRARRAGRRGRRHRHHGQDDARSSRELWQRMLDDDGTPGALAAGGDAGIVSWLDDLDDDDEPEFDEADIRVRPNPKANRPRTKRRPAHADAEIARVLGRRPRPLHRARRRGRPRRAHACSACAPASCARCRSSRATARASSATAPATSGTLARIVGIEERTSLLRRSADDTDQVERIIVANADQMLVVVAAADPEPRARLVDRYLVAALDAGIRPLLVVTKTDLADPTDVPRALRGPRPRGVHERARRDAARADRRRARRALARSSSGTPGVGKSTLVNALVPDARRADRSRQRRHRPRASHLELDRVAALPRRRRQRLGHRHAGRALVRARPRRPGEHPARRSPTSPRSPRSARAAARTCRTPRTAPSSRPSPRGGSARAARRASTRCSGCSLTFADKSLAASRAPTVAALRWNRDHHAPRTRLPRPRLHPRRPGRAGRDAAGPARRTRHPVLLSRGDDARLHQGGVRLPRQPRAAAGRRLHDPRHLARRAREAPPIPRARRSHLRPAERPRPQGPREVRRVGREAELRQDRDGRHPLDLRHRREGAHRARPVQRAGDRSRRRASARCSDVDATP